MKRRFRTVQSLCYESKWRGWVGRFQKIEDLFSSAFWTFSTSFVKWIYKSQKRVSAKNCLGFVWCQLRDFRCYKPADLPPTGRFRKWLWVTTSRPGFMDQPHPLLRYLKARHSSSWPVSLVQNQWNPFRKGPMSGHKSLGMSLISQKSRWVNYRFGQIRLVEVIFSHDLSRCVSFFHMALTKSSK